MTTINFKSIFFFSLVLTSLLYSCDEKEGQKQDNISPEIEILSPSIANTYLSGDTVYIQAKITDNDQLHEISAFISRKHGASIDRVWNYETHSHNEVFDLLAWYVIEVPGMHNDFTLSITASDHNGNEGNKEFHFHVME